jgi:glyoxylase-like metal-dependent hydrolase (beta-lactamase superfamily II)
MLQVKRIINDIFTSNTYIVWDDKYDYCWLVDIGDFHKVAEALPPNIEIRGVFLTHTHFDHISGLNALHRANPNCRVFTAEYGKEALYDEKKNFSLFHETPFVYEGEDVVTIGEEATIELYPNVFIMSNVTIGHCPSCLTYALNEWVFSGDAYIPGTRVVTKLPKGNRLLAEESVKKILHLSEGKLLCPGHGTMVRI